MTTVFGLTGGIASGKSTVSAIFREEGVAIVDADVVARDVVQPGTPGLRAVISAFGIEYLAPDGTLDRKKLGRFVFADRTKLATLDSILGPFVMHALATGIGEAAQDGATLICVDAAILIEKGWHDRFHPVVVVACDPDVQLQRIMKRDKLSEEDARSRLAAQLPLAEKLAHAAYVIWNNDGLDALQARAREVVAKVRVHED